MRKMKKVMMWLCVSMLIPLIGEAQDRILQKFEPQDSIEAIQEKIQRNGFNFRVERNWVYDMPDEEKERFFNRRMPMDPKWDEQMDVGPLGVLLQKREALPDRYDSRNDNGKAYIGPARNQGRCGSCYSFGASAAAEGSYNKANGFYCDPEYKTCSPGFADFSEAFIAFCLSKYPEYMDHFNECNGSDYDFFELDALVKKGIVEEKVLPYQETNPGKCSAGNIPFTPTVKFTSWHRVLCSDVDAIKKAIMEYGVVDAAVLVTSAFQAYKSGIYEDTTTTCDYNPCYYSDTNHAVALVGWDDNNGNGYWILRNSWGPNWGENGYMRIRYHAAHVSCEATYLVYNSSTPRVTTLPPEKVTQNSAAFKGIINPRNLATTFYFEYGSTNAFESKTSSGQLGAISQDVSINLDVSGLKEQTTYFYRLVASNSSGTSYGEKMSFFTSQGGVKPSATTGSANSVTATSAILTAVINPKGDTTTYYFEYGTTSSYGSLLAQTTSTLTGSSDISVSDSILKLNPSTTYHYRVVAENSTGKTYGDNQTFTTESAMTNVFRDGGFEAGQPNPYWEDEARLMIKNIYKVDTSIPENPKPLSGDWLIWFAGGGTYRGSETAHVAQNFIIPKSHTATLKFQWQKYCPCGVPGTITVKLDNAELMTYNQQPITTLTEPRKWETVSKDITAYADGRNHTLRFEVTIEEGKPEDLSTDFLVDDVVVIVEKPSLDVNSDGYSNLGDVIYMLQFFSGMRQDVIKTTSVFGNSDEVTHRTRNVTDQMNRFLK